MLSSRQGMPREISGLRLEISKSLAQLKCVPTLACARRMGVPGTSHINGVALIALATAAPIPPKQSIPHHRDAPPRTWKQPSDPGRSHHCF